MRPTLDYFGGKWILAPWIIKSIPEHKSYVEPFGGAASVLLRKEKSKLEIYNDLDEEIVNVFKVLRETPNELKTILRLTPYSRSEYYRCIQKSFNPLEQARRTIVKSFLGIGDSIHSNSGFRNSKLSNTNPAKSFKSWVEELDEITDRLRDVVIENLDFKTCILKYDTKDTFFYLDPPYVKATRSKKYAYRHDCESVHKELLEIIPTIKGKFILSGYESELYKDLPYEKLFKETRTQKNKRTEFIWKG